MKRRHFIQAAAGCTLNFGFTRLPFFPDPQEGILIKVLGTAQDGGLPQLGCSCDNCRRAREQSGFSRRIASLAIIDLGRESIFLVDQKKKQILFTHLNHSNPAVDPESQAYKEIVRQGFAVAAEGQEFIL